MKIFLCTLTLFLQPKRKNFPTDLKVWNYCYLIKKKQRCSAEAKIESIEDSKLSRLKLKNAAFKKLLLRFMIKGFIILPQLNPVIYRLSKLKLLMSQALAMHFLHVQSMGFMHEESLLRACQLGLAGSALTLQTEESVSTPLKPEKIYEIVEDFCDTTILLSPRAEILM